MGQSDKKQRRKKFNIVAVYGQQSRRGQQVSGAGGMDANNN